MKRNLLSNFVFFNVKVSKYHYTDNRAGVAVNYLAYLRKGTAKIISENDTIDIKEGDLFFIPKNLSYQSYWYGNDEIDFLSCSFSSLLTGEDLNYKLQVISCSDEIKNEVQAIFEEDTPLSSKSLAHFYTAIAAVLPTLKRKSESKELLLAEKIRECIENNPHASLKDVAKLCAISESYMYDLFKRATGNTPNDYKLKIICEEGIELLLTTNKKIEEIASILNFSSSSYFRKVLKKHTGSSPGEIRRNRGF